MRESGLGMPGVGVGIWGIRGMGVRMREIWVEMRGIRVGMQGIGVGMWGIELK